MRLFLRIASFASSSPQPLSLFSPITPTLCSWHRSKARTSKCDRTRGLLYDPAYPLTCSGNWQPRTIEEEDREGAVSSDAPPQTLLYNKLIVSPRDNYGNPIKLNEFFKDEGLPDTDKDFDLINATKKHNLEAMLVKLDVTVMKNRGGNLERKSYKILENRTLETLEDELETEVDRKTLRYSVIVRPSKNDMVVKFVVPTKFSNIKPFTTAEKRDLDSGKREVLPVAPSLEVTISIKSEEGGYFPVKTLLHPGGEERHFLRS